MMLRFRHTGLQPAYECSSIWRIPCSSRDMVCEALMSGDLSDTWLATCATKWAGRESSVIPTLRRFGVNWATAYLMRKSSTFVVGAEAVWLPPNKAMQLTRRPFGRFGV